jgi:hypothetical protein
VCTVQYVFLQRNLGTEDQNKVLKILAFKTPYDVI